MFMRVIHFTFALSQRGQSAINTGHTATTIEIVALLDLSARRIKYKEVGKKSKLERRNKMVHFK